MKRTSTKILVIFLIGLFGAFLSIRESGAADEVDRLRSDLLRIVQDDAFQTAQFGIAVESVKTGNPLFQYNEKKRFVPASNMKLYTSAAALLALTPGFTYETTLSTEGTIASGVLAGNVIVTASGDPTISGYFNGNNPTSVFEKWAESILQKGIREITGDIVIDNNAFHDTPMGTGWNWDDADRCYSAPKNAFSFNNNCLALTVRPGNKPGQAAKITMEPETAYFTVLNKVTTGASSSRMRIKTGYAGNTTTVAVSGVIPVNGRDRTEYLAIRNPVQFGGFVLKETLVRKGVKVWGDIYCTNDGCAKRVDAKTPSAPARQETPTILASYRSPELSEIIKVVNKLSNNLYTELLFLTIARVKQRPVNAQEASLAVREILNSAGVALDGFDMVDGSGLSRYNLITPEETSGLLRMMAQNAYFNAFRDSLAVAGEEGTLKNRRKGEVWEGNIRAKTGTMTHVRNLSGYVTTRDGELLTFSILCNNHGASSAVIDSLYDKILSRLADFSRDY